MKANVIRCDHCGAPLRIKNHTGTASVAECQFCKNDNRLTTTDEIQPHIVAPIKKEICITVAEKPEVQESLSSNHIEEEHAIRRLLIGFALFAIALMLFAKTNSAPGSEYDFRHHISTSAKSSIRIDTNTLITPAQTPAQKQRSEYCDKKCGKIITLENVSCILNCVNATDTTKITAKPKQKTIVEYTDMTRVAVKKGYTIPVIRESGI